MIDIFLAKVKKINDGHKFICFDPTHVYQWVWVLVSPQELVEKGTGLEAAKITLCVSICAPSSQARVTSENFSSFLFLQKLSLSFPGSRSISGRGWKKTFSGVLYHISWYIWPFWTITLRWLDKHIMQTTHILESRLSFILYWNVGRSCESQSILGPGTTIMHYSPGNCSPETSSGPVKIVMYNDLWLYPHLWWSCFSDVCSNWLQKGWMISLFAFVFLLAIVSFHMFLQMCLPRGIIDAKVALVFKLGCS